MTHGWNRGLAFIICALGPVGCGRTGTLNEDVAVPKIEDITAEQWERLATARIFFGHQSVGGNVLEGVQELLAQRQTGLRVVEIDASGEMQEPGLYHAAVGRNGEPATKLSEFRAVVENRMGESGMAVLKYCYADIALDTDPEALFSEYRQAVDELRARQPEMKVVHATLPLVTDIGTLRYAAAAVRRLPSGREQNLIRHRYNELLRQTYEGKDPIFDLARLESTRADGGASAVRFRGATVPVLAAEWTYDGGHLNEAGRRRAAEAFLVTLAQAYESGTSAP